MSHVTFYLLGPPRIERDGRPVSVDTRKAVALFAYLAISKQRHTRDALAALLWPEYDQTKARATLRRTLSALNKALADDSLDVDRETIALAPGRNLWLDVDAFHGHLAECRTHGHPPGDTCLRCLHPLSEAVSLYRDDFLSGFGLRESDTFDEWQYFQAEGLRRELASALEQLVKCYIATGDFAPAIQHARRWLAVDHLHEPAHRQLMLLYAWSGQRAAALRQYRDCVQVLEQELGVAPLEATTQLYRTIKENQTVEWDLDHGLPGAKSRPFQPLHEEPRSRVQSDLVGRATEWAALLHAHSSISDTGHVLTLTGEAGIGKTRLAEEFLEHARTRGTITAAARSYEGEANLAYGPVIALLKGLLDRSDSEHRLESLPVQWLSEAARLVPEIAAVHPGMAAPALDSPGAQSRFFEGVRQALRALCAGEGPGVLFFDDLQWTDAASVDLLTYLVRRLVGWPLCLVLACRSDPVAGNHRLHQTLAEAQRSGLSTQLSLSRLSRSHVKEMVRSAVGAGESASAGADAAYEELTQRLYGETEGLPFFVVAYLAALEKGPQPVSGDWALPGGVRDLLKSRLIAVSQTGKQLLNAASVIGRSFDFQTLHEASGRSEEETISGLEELISLGLVVEVGLSQVAGGTGDHPLNYDFSHEKLRTLTYEETSLARRRLLHRRVAEALAARGRGSGEISSAPGAIANHYMLAGNEAAAARYFKLAGEQARSLYANSEALSHFRMSLTLGHPDASELHEAIGDMHTLMAEYGAALSSYETAASLLDRELPTGETLASLEYKLGGVYQRRGEWELAESHYEAALQALGEIGPPDARARIYADWSLSAHHSSSKRRLDGSRYALPGRSSPASTAPATPYVLARRALELAEMAQDTRALAQAHNILGILASSNNDSDLARYHLEQSLALAESLNDAGRRAAALNNLALALGAAGDSGQAIALAETALQLCVSQGDRHREAALHNNLADLLHESGRQAEAIAHLKQAVAIYAEIGVEAGDVQPAIWKLAEW